MNLSPPTVRGVPCAAPFIDVVSFISFLVLSLVSCYRNDIVLHRDKLWLGHELCSPQGGWALLLFTFLAAYCEFVTHKKFP